MGAIEPLPAAEEVELRKFLCILRTLLLLCVVLASSLAVFGVWGIPVFVLSVALAAYLRYPMSSKSLVCLVLAALCLGFLLLLNVVSSPRESNRRTACLNNLRQIALALQLYHGAHGCYPPAYIGDRNGKPMHSWRVLLLPFLDEAALYDKCDFGEPWDGPNNKKLLRSRPPLYACPGDRKANSQDSTRTSYVAVVGANAAWPGTTPRNLAAGFPGGTYRTIMLVEIENSDIPWTEPRDLSLDALGSADGRRSVPLAGGNHPLGQDFFFTNDDRRTMNVALADGSVYRLDIAGPPNDALAKLLELGACPAENREDGVVRIGSRHLNWPNIAALAVWLLSTGAMFVQAVRGRNPPPAARCLP